MGDNKSSRVQVPYVILDSLTAAGLSIDDIPSPGRFTIQPDVDRKRWWVTVDVFTQSDDGRKVLLVGDELAVDTKVIPFIGGMEGVA